jgi:hypothetical protein
MVREVTHMDGIPCLGTLYTSSTKLPLFFSVLTHCHTLTEAECIICCSTCNMQEMHFKVKNECGVSEASQKFFNFEMKLVVKMEEHSL